MLKYLIIIGVLIGTIPFWLPTSLGGNTSYHFVLTDSMKGSLDPGSFVILHRSDSYDVGQAVGYLSELGGQPATILHRIVGREPDGTYILKGDAVTSTEEVEEEAITGRLVFAVPALGFLPGAFRQAPLLLGGLMLAVVLLTAGVKKADRGRLSRLQKDTVDPGRASWLKKSASAKQKDGGPAKNQELKLFIPAALVVLFALPFTTVPVADVLPQLPFLSVVDTITQRLPLFVLLIFVIAVTRFGEVLWTKGPSQSSGASIVGLNYGAVMLIAITVVPFAELIQATREVLAF